MNYPFNVTLVPWKEGTRHCIKKILRVMSSCHSVKKFWGNMALGATFIVAFIAALWTPHWLLRRNSLKRWGFRKVHRKGFPLAITQCLVPSFQGTKATLSNPSCFGYHYGNKCTLATMNGEICLLRSSFNNIKSAIKSDINGTINYASC